MIQSSSETPKNILQILWKRWFRMPKFVRIANKQAGSNSGKRKLKTTHSFALDDKINTNEMARFWNSFLFQNKSELN